MARKFVDDFEYNKILSLKSTNPFEAKKLMEEYLKKYPKDYIAACNYCDILVLIGEMNEAEKVLNSIITIANNDKYYNRDHNRTIKLNERVLYSKIKILAYQERYNELYKLCLDNKQLLKKKMDYYHLLFFCQKQLGTLEDDKLMQKTYLYMQIINYSEELMMEHIKKHSVDYNRDLDNPKDGIFVLDFPFEKVIEEIKKYIPSEKRLYSGIIEDKYVFKYDGCGRHKNKLQDYIKVICFHNTNNIISMYPAEGVEHLPSVDLNYLAPKKGPELVRRKSQIEKFNMRYIK